VRQPSFRLTVVPAYNYTCALTGYRCVTVNAGSIVDAAHIHQFADSRNNHPQNGLALSKNAHWMFDTGLWSLDDDYRVLVAKDRFDEAGDVAFLLKRMAGRQAELDETPARRAAGNPKLPGNRDFWPDKTNLAWHREHRMGFAMSVSLPQLGRSVSLTQLR
jgi:putative restriction endonuclease